MTHTNQTPSSWITRFIDICPSPSRALDLACGQGRHGRLFLEKGCDVDFVDLNLDGLADLKDHAKATLKEIDLEDGKDWPFAKNDYDVIIVTNYLYRPHLNTICDSLNKGGILLYETFALGNERFGRPRNPDFLLQPGELLQISGKDMQVIAYEHGVDGEKAVQRICAAKTTDPTRLFSLS